jgi:hypothetical protein
MATLTPAGKRSRDDLSFCVIVEDDANNIRSEMVINPSDTINNVKTALEVEFIPLHFINRTFDLKLGETVLNPELTFADYQLYRKLLQPGVEVSYQLKIHWTS